MLITGQLLIVNFVGNTRSCQEEGCISLANLKKRQFVKTIKLFQFMIDINHAII